METPKLNLKGWGPCHSEILWKEGNLFKIKFFHFTETKTEVFHHNEILNFDEIFIDKHLNITKYVY